MHREPDLTFYHLLPSGESIRADVWKDESKGEGMEITSTCHPDEIPKGEIKPFFNHVENTLLILSGEEPNG